MRVDLHTHTTASDGLCTPGELVERAATDRVDVVAVTDHDTVGGVEDAVAHAEHNGVRVVAGIELSARHGERNVHVLGFFLDVASVELSDTLASLAADRMSRAREIVDRLCELGYELSWRDVAEQAGGVVIGRPHIARALVARGHIAQVRDAFTPEFIADGGRADVPKRALTPTDAVALIRSAGGVAVVAHPGVGHHEGQAQPLSVELLAEMRDAGMVGLEVDHPDHDPLMREGLARVADDLGLVVTGGSDFHGDEGHTLGAALTSPESLEALEGRAG